jgi:hypothetical protein
MRTNLDCSFLRERAYQSRVLAGGMRDVSVRKRLLALATEYEALALQMDQLRPVPPSWEGAKIL